MRIRTVRRANGPAIRALREIRDLRQYELAEVVGISSNYLGNIENQRCDASMRVLNQLAAALGVEVSALVADPEIAKALDLTANAA